MILDWLKWYIECGWLWMIWGLQVAFNYSVAYLVTYGPNAVKMAAMLMDFYCFIVMGIGTRILRKAEKECSIL